MRAGPFEGVDQIQLVTCKSTIENKFQLLQLKDFNSTLLVSWVKDGGKCEASGPNFAACVFDEDENVVTLKVVITDLLDGEPRIFFCSALYVTGSGATSTNYNITVTYKCKY